MQTSLSPSAPAAATARQVRWREWRIPRILWFVLPLPFAFTVLGLSAWGWANGFEEEGLIAAQIVDVGLRALVLFVGYASYPVLIWGGARIASRLAEDAGSRTSTPVLEVTLSLTLTLTCVYDLARDLATIASAS